MNKLDTLKHGNNGEIMKTWFSIKCQARNAFSRSWNTFLASEHPLSLTRLGLLELNFEYLEIWIPGWPKNIETLNCQKAMRNFSLVVKYTNHRMNNANKNQINPKISQSPITSRYTDCTVQYSLNLTETNITTVIRHEKQTDV